MTLCLALTVQALGAQLDEQFVDHARHEVPDDRRAEAGDGERAQDALVFVARGPAQSLSGSKLPPPRVGQGNEGRLRGDRGAHQLLFREVAPALV